MWREFRLAFRSLLKQPGFTAVAVITIALGVGANSAIFTVVDAVMLRPLPFRDAHRVVIVNEHLPQLQALSMSRENYQDVCAQARSFAACGAFRSLTMNLSGAAEPQRVSAKMMTANLPGLVGVPPIEGRTFTADEDKVGGEHVVVLSYGMWRSQFARSKTALGGKLLLDGQPYTVIGVMPASFVLFQPADLYLPIGAFLAAQPDDRSWHPGINLLARLKDGVPLQQAQTEVGAIGERLARAYPVYNTGVSMTVTEAQELLVQGVRTALLVLLGAVAGVLLIACINVAGLLLARGLSRRRDLAVRVALGASHTRIIGHLLAESVLIGFGGGAVGLLLAATSIPVLLRLVGPALPRADAVTIDGRVILFTFGLALMTGVLFGLIPALQSARVDVRDALNEGGRSGMGGGVWQRRARAALVVTEIAVTLVLTIGAALLIGSFARLQDVSPGFNTDHALVAELPLSNTRYQRDDARTAAVRRVLDRLAALPGVRGAAAATALPMTGAGSSIHFNIKGRPRATPDHYALAGYRAVTGTYFPTIGIPLERGRLLDEHDRQGSAPVIVINHTMARQFFAGQDPIGQHIQLGATPDPEPGVPYMEIVGVVGDVRQQPDADARSEMYVPYAQYPLSILQRLYSNVTLVVRTAGRPAQLAGAVREAVLDLDRDQPVANVRTMDAVLSASVAQPRFRTTLLGLFAGTALLLAAIGIYGLLAHGVAQRANEFGLRLALGASRSTVLAMVMKEGLMLGTIGVAIGMAAAALAVRALTSVLFSVSPWDPAAWIASTATLLAVSALASWIPARRALNTDPVIALRQ